MLDVSARLSAADWLHTSKGELSARLTREQVHKALAAQVDQKAKGTNTPIGQILVDLGLITDKDRNHWSTIYKVEMPYFMRLSCLDFGMHEGVVPNYPASHGCIRLPGDAARKFFAEIPIGTLVTVK